MNKDFSIKANKNFTAIFRINDESDTFTGKLFFKSKVRRDGWKRGRNRGE